MQTVIVRLSAPSGDGKLHGLVEVVGASRTAAFANDDELLELLHEAGGLAAERSGHGPEGIA